jgi:hypothetical protein
VKALTVERPCVLRQSVPVRAIFFLVHSDAESAVPVGAGRAALSIYDAAMQVFMSVDFAAGIPGGSTYMRKLFENAAEMAAAVPSFVLRVSLQGRFWECVERALDQVSGAVCGGRTGESRHSTRLSGEGCSGIDQRHIA